MIPGFITLYKGIDNLPHLYFYKGETDEGKPYYNDLDLSKCKYDFTSKVYEDGAIEYIFNNSNIIRIRYKLYNYKGEEESSVLELK